jgi:pyruvate dehydrogenase E2 component (dihydrolipoamide acetyltransferase)
MAEIMEMPKLSDTMSEGVVAAWHKKIGEKVKSGELLAEVETDKATMELESYFDGILLYTGVEQGGAVPVGKLLAIIGKEGEDIASIISKYTKDSPQVSEADEKKLVVENTPVREVSASSTDGIHLNPESEGRIKASPLAKAIAKEKGLNLNNISGTGEGGRIIKKDIDSYFSSNTFETNSYPSTHSESFTDTPVSQMRKTIARRLSESKFTAPHFYLTMDIDMDKAIENRNAINTVSESKISFNDFIVKAVANALKKHPKVNSSFLNDKIRTYNYVHIGVAVAVDEGLLVPVIRFADTKSLSQISTETKNLAQKARNKQLQPQDWEGNTFTISNLGMYGIESFTAIINPPDACIMAIGGISQVPVIKNGQVVPGNIMKVTLSCDHRVVDGATGSEFLLSFKQFMENPVLLLL